MLSLNSGMTLGRFLKLSSSVSLFLDKDKIELLYAYAYMLYKIKEERKKNLNLEHVLSIVRIIEVLLLLSFKIIFRWKINYIVCFL